MVKRDGLRSHWLSAYAGSNPVSRINKIKKQSKNKQQKMLSKRKLKKRAERKEAPELKELIILLKKQKKPLWQKTASLLARPRKKAISVNLDKLNKFTKADDVVIVPGKVLGQGKLDHKLTIAAYNFSESAKTKLEKLKADAINIPDLIERLKATKGIIVKIII